MDKQFSQQSIYSLSSAHLNMDSGDERRFCVLLPSSVFQQNTGYFGDLIREKKNGGVEAMMFDLLNYDYSHIYLRKAPMTE